MCAMTRLYVRHGSFNQHNSNHLLTIQPDAMVRERMHTSRTWISVMSHVWMSHVTQLTSCHTSYKKELPLLLCFVKKVREFFFQERMSNVWYIVNCVTKTKRLCFFFGSKKLGFFFLQDVWHDVYRVTNTLLAFSFCFFSLLLFVKKKVRDFLWEPDATVCDTCVCVCVCHESFTCAPWLIHVWACDVTHLLIRVPWLIRMWNVTFSYGIGRHMWHVTCRCC